MSKKQQIDKPLGEHDLGAIGQGAKSPAFTPGPWVVDVDRRSKRAPVTMLMVVAERGGMPGLIVNQPPVVTDRDWANARLIAAAPELLSALVELTDALDAIVDFQMYGDPDDDDSGGEDIERRADKAADAARSAIAKATGRGASKGSG